MEDKILPSPSRSKVMVLEKLTKIMISQTSDHTELILTYTLSTQPGDQNMTLTFKVKDQGHSANTLKSRYRSIKLLVVES